MLPPFLQQQGSEIPFFHPLRKERIRVASNNQREMFTEQTKPEGESEHCLHSRNSTLPYQHMRGGQQGRKLSSTTGLSLLPVGAGEERRGGRGGRGHHSHHGRWPRTPGGTAESFLPSARCRQRRLSAGMMGHFGEKKFNSTDEQERSLSKIFPTLIHLYFNAFEIKLGASLAEVF